MLFPKFDGGEAKFQMKVPDQTTVKRFTIQGIGSEILAQFNLEKGLGYTIKSMLVAPAKAIETYLFYDRTKMMRPLPFLLLVVTVTTFALLWYFPVDQEVNNTLRASGLSPSLIPAIELFIELSRQYYNILLMSALPVISLGSFLLFREAGLNYAEHLIINTYMYSIQSILTLPFIPFLITFPLLSAIIPIITAGYYLYAYKSIFQITWGEVTWKAIVIFLISQMLQGILFVIVIFIFWLVL